MDLTLIRAERRKDGVFGVLLNDKAEQIAVTLEHSYHDGKWPDEEVYISKLPPGSYQCVRGQHQLHSMNQPFTTFEITGVEGHKNILFHVGNYNQDSDGCVLLGKYKNEVGGQQMIGLSRKTFSEFMKLQEGIPTFTLTVKDI